MILSQRTQTVDKIGGFLHIILPATEGYESFKISVTDLLSGDLQPIFLENKTGNINFAISANTFFESGVFEKISGTPIIRIGITPAGQEILEDFLCTEIDTKMALSYLVEADGYIYISIQNGTLDLRFDIITNFKNL